MTSTAPLARKRKGFTLIEILAVILILAILIAIGLPLYLKAVADSAKKTCQANMHTLANAEQAYMVRSLRHEYVQIQAGPEGYAFTGMESGEVIADFVGPEADLQAMPVCPAGGRYEVAVHAGGLPPQAQRILP